MKKAISILTLIFLPLMISAQIIVPEPLSQRTTRYQISAELDPDTKTVSGEVNMIWVNPSNDTVSDLQFHLYLNAFKNSQSTMMKEGRLLYRSADEFGYTDIRSIRQGNGFDLSRNSHFLQPDNPQPFRDFRWTNENPILPDQRIQDETVLQVFPEHPVLPGDSIEVVINFTSKLPKLSQRTGYAENYFFVAQWFPKLGVYEYPGMKSGVESGWNCHAFHPTSEFYSNHSLYEVQLTLPEDYIVGSGGVVQSKTTTTDGKQILDIRAEDIVDFAWTASQDYVLVEDQWKGVKIKGLFQPEHLYQSDRHINALKGALAYLDEHVGPYPWPHVTLIDPPAYGQGASGMEYTTMFTAGTTYGMPAGVHMPELVTVHEFGHSYFMGMLATNEFEEPWMDEGINTYWESRIMDHLYGDGKGVMDLPFAHLGDVELSRLTYLSMSNPKLADGLRAAWEFPHGSYGSIVYQKSATWLNMLERIITQPVMDEVFQEYYKRWAFKHPASQDFIDVVNEVVAKHYGDQFGDNMDWFFDQFLKDDKMVDYAVTRISVTKVNNPSGYMGTGDHIRYEERESTDLYRSTIYLERLEEAVVPVEIRVLFDDGQEIIENWDGRDRAHDLVYERKAKVVLAQIDPELKILMDDNLLNNSVTVEKDNKAALKFGAKFLFFLQNLMQIVSVIS